MGAAFRYCPAIVENALFYLDCYIASAIGEGKAVLTKEKFQVSHGFSRCKKICPAARAFCTLAH